ncbi:MAG: sortase [Clostridia bacterium]|nr:sortase [Clostridia bacterium]
MRKVIIKFMIFVGVLLILYPALGKLYANINQTTVISNYEKQITSITEDDKEKMKEDYNEYNKKILDEEFISKVNGIDLGEIIGYISIPKIHIYLPIYEGTSNEILLQGIGHLENTALPIRRKEHKCCSCRTYRYYSKDIF